MNDRIRSLLLLAAVMLGCTRHNPAFDGGNEGDGGGSADEAGPSTTTSLLPPTSDASATATSVASIDGTSAAVTSDTPPTSDTSSTSDDPRPASSGEVEPQRALLITQFGDDSLALDTTLADTLVARGLEVVLIEDDEVTAADAEAVDLVVISETATATAVADELRHVARPVIVLEGYVWEDMGMAPYPSWAPGTVAFIDMPEHELAAGLSGEVAVLTVNPGSGLFGTIPPPAALVIGRTLPELGPVTVFAFELEAPMLDGFPAPAARVGLGFDVDGNGATGSTGNLSEDGAAIFAAAIDWALP